MKNILLISFLFLSCTQKTDKITEYENCMASKIGTPIDQNECAYQAGLKEWINDLIVIQSGLDQIIIDTTEYQLYVYDEYCDLQIQAQVAIIVEKPIEIWCLPEPKLYPDSILLYYKEGVLFPNQ